MQKQFLGLVLSLLIMALLSGCPKPVDPPVTQGLSVYIDLNSVATGDQKGADYPDVPLGFQRQIGKAFKDKAANVELSIYESLGEIKGGGGPDYSLYRMLPVIDGVAQGQIALPVGIYWLSAKILDQDYRPLFEAYGDIEVVADTVSETELEFDFLYSYMMNLQVTGLPAMEIESVTAIDQNGIEYSAANSFFDGGDLFVYIDLPLSFTGSALVINQIGGGQLLADFPLTLYMVNFAMYDFSDYYPLAYQAPQSAGQVAIIASFGFEKRFIRVDGLDYNSIQEAALSSANPTIMVGPGDYYGLELSGNLTRSVTIYGAGAGVTRIIPNGNGPIISMDYPTGGLGKAAIAPTLRLANVTIDAYGSYAGLSLWGCGLDMSNCHILGSGGTVVMMGSPAGVSVNHCLFEGSGGFAIELSNYQSNLVSLKNSIFMGYQMTALYLDTYDTNGADGLVYQSCCFSGMDQAWPMAVTCQSAITADPMLDWETMLPTEGSPCLDAGDDGFNIGLLWSE